jgi:hypothetical protein
MNKNMDLNIIDNNNNKTHCEFHRTTLTTISPLVQSNSIFQQPTPPIQTIIDYGFTQWISQRNEESAYQFNDYSGTIRIIVHNDKTKFRLIAKEDQIKLSEELIPSYIINYDINASALTANLYAAERCILKYPKVTTIATSNNDFLTGLVHIQQYMCNKYNFNKFENKHAYEIIDKHYTQWMNLLCAINTRNIKWENHNINNITT